MASAQYSSILVDQGTNYLSALPSDDPTGSSGFIISNATTLRITENRTPSSSSAAGYAGELCSDDNYLYRYTSAGSWTRIAWNSF